MSYLPAVLADGVPASTPIQYSVPTGSTFPLGDTTVHVTAEAPGFRVRSCTFVVTVADTTAPETILDTTPPVELRRRAAIFRFSSNDPDADFECKLRRRGYRRDGERRALRFERLDSFRPCASPYPFGRLPRGRYVFVVFALDQAGNGDPSPERYEFRRVRRDAR